MRPGPFLFCLLLAPPALAEDWHPLDGPAIRTALESRSLIYDDNTTQDFRSDGRTLYGTDSWGKWRVDGDRYCSAWPPSDAWACYDMAQDGLRLKFISDDGSESIGTYNDR
jgi:hypothetical protein